MISPLARRVELAGLAAPRAANDKVSVAMNHSRLQILAGAARMDTILCERLLNGQRRQVAVEFGLSRREVDAVMEIEASTVQDFAVGLLNWMTQQQPGES